MGGGPQKEKLLILLQLEEDKSITDPLRKKFPEYEIEYITITPHGNYHDVESIPKEKFKDITALFTLSLLPQPPDAPSLSWIHFLSAGTNHIQTHPIYTSTSIPLTTSTGVHGPQISEWVLMNLLVHNHRYNLLHSLQVEHQWGNWKSQQEFRKLRDLVGQRVGVLGYGSIGRQVGRVCRAAGMDVVAYTASPKETEESRRDNGYIVPGTGDREGSIPSRWFSGLDKKSLHNFLGQDLDVLLVSVPLTKDTEHFLSTEEFKILGKNKAFVINIARGRIIDQDALITALKDGTLSGAALDVTDPEPLPEDSPLWDMENVIVTPHISGVGVMYAERAFKILEINMEHRRNGEKMINVVDRKRGY